MNVPLAAARWKIITRMVTLEADKTTIRVLLGTASFVWAAILFCNVMLGRHIMERPAYEILRLFGNDWAWMGYFMIHFVGVLWRTYTARKCIACALLVNTYGCAIWAYTTIAINSAIDFMSPTFGLEIVVCIYAGLALYGTGWKDEIVTD